MPYPLARLNNSTALNECFNIMLPEPKLPSHAHGPKSSRPHELVHTVKLDLEKLRHLRRSKQLMAIGDLRLSR